MKQSFPTVSVPLVHDAEAVTDVATSDCPDLHSASVSYARRFQGPAGRWLLQVQTDALLDLMAPWTGASVLDVGGGHGQVTGPLARAGHRVVLQASSAAAAGFAKGRAEGVVYGPLAHPPLPERSVDVAVALRMMAHVEDWRALLRGLCRTAGDAVIVDFPITGGVNMLEPVLFGVKQRLEDNTRRYLTMRKAEVRDEFARLGFEVDAVIGQFVWPMVLHRKLDRPGISAGLEGLARSVRLDRWIGTPVLMRARRRA